MRRQIGISIFIAQLFFCATIQGFAQQAPGQQSPTIPDDMLGSRLIAWSQMQKPEPVMQRQSQEHGGLVLRQGDSLRCAQSLDE